MFIFSSTFNLLYHFKMRQPFVFTLIIVLITQFDGGLATELLIESAESRLLDLRVADRTNVHNSSDGLHQICKQVHHDEFQLSMDANGHKCIVGRCECPEEWQFCTNNADSKNKYQKPIIYYHDPGEQFGQTRTVPAKESSSTYESDSKPAPFAGKDDIGSAFISHYQLELDTAMIVWISVMFFTFTCIVLYGKTDLRPIIAFIVINGLCLLYFNVYFFMYGVPELVFWVNLTVVILLLVYVVWPFLRSAYRVFTTAPRHNHAVYHPEPPRYSPVRGLHPDEPRPRRRRQY